MLPAEMLAAAVEEDSAPPPVLNLKLRLKPGLEAAIGTAASEALIAPITLSTASKGKGAGRKGAPPKRKAPPSSAAKVRSRVVDRSFGRCVLQ